MFVDHKVWTPLFRLRAYVPDVQEPLLTYESSNHREFTQVVENLSQNSQISSISIVSSYTRRNPDVRSEKTT